MFTLCLHILMEWLAQVKTQVQVHVNINFQPNTPFHALHTLPTSISCYANTAILMTLIYNTVKKVRYFPVPSRDVTD
jgi:hypothetical protein